MLKRAISSSLLCLVVLVPSAVGQTHHGKAKTTVRLETEVPMGNFGDFTGTVDSSKASCKNDRKLRVVLRKPGKDKVVGGGPSENGAGSGPTPYDITARVNKSGHYYVLAPATAKCSAGKSNAFLINVVN